MCFVPRGAACTTGSRLVLMLKNSSLIHYHWALACYPHNLYNVVVILLRGVKRLTNPLIQIVVLLVVLVVWQLLKRIKPLSKMKNGPLLDLIPVILLAFMWFLTHSWDAPWFATVICIWMIGAIFLTIVWGLARGEILWDQFLLLFWRASLIFLTIAYFVTISASFWIV